MEERQKQEIEALKRSLQDDVSQKANTMQNRVHHVHPAYTGSHSVCLPSQVVPQSGPACTQQQHSHGLTHSASASQLRHLVSNNNAAPSNAASKNSVPTSPDHH